MALVKCSECGKEVSAKVTVCPHCGAPVASHKSASRVNPLVIIMLIFYSIFAMYSSWRYFMSISYDVVGYLSFIVYYLFMMIGLWLLYFYVLFHKKPLRFVSIILFLISLIFSLAYYVIYLLGFHPGTLLDLFQEVVYIFCDFVQRYIVFGLLYLFVKKESNDYGTY